MVISKTADTIPTKEEIKTTKGMDTVAKVDATETTMETEVTRTTKGVEAVGGTETMTMKEETVEARGVEKVNFFFFSPFSFNEDRSDGLITYEPKTQVKILKKKFLFIYLSFC